MAANSKTFDPAYAIGGTEASKESLFTRIFRRFIASREAKGRAVAYGHLARLAPERLVDLGFSQAEIRNIKAHADVAPSYWV